MGLNEWWVREAAKVFRANGLCESGASEAAQELAAELDEAGLADMWRGDASGAAERQIREWDKWAREAR